MTKKKCIHIDELKSDGTKVCRLFLDWKEGGATTRDSLMILERDADNCRCEMYCDEDEERDDNEIR